MYTCTALEFARVSKVYKNGLLALNQLTFRLQEGGFYALLGLNGAGKSTAIRLLSMLTRPTSGRIQVFDQMDIYQAPLKVKRWLGIMPQEINLNLFQTVREVLTVHGGLYGLSKSATLARAKSLLDRLQLGHKFDAPIKDLSGGMKRRVLLIRALLSEPRLLVLDEPTAGLDIEVRRATWDLIQEVHRSGTTILMTTHYLEEAEQLCSDGILLKKGEAIFDGSLQAFKSRLGKAAWQIGLDRPISDELLAQIGHTNRMDDLRFQLRRDDSSDLNRALAFLLDKSYKILECSLIEPSLESVLFPEAFKSAVT